jgi:epoxyqueuosine reductase
MPTSAQIVTELKRFTIEEALNYLSDTGGIAVYEPPLVGFADGFDPLFLKFKTMVGPEHFSPSEALTMATGCNPDTITHLSIIAWALIPSIPVRASNRRRTRTTSRLAAMARDRGGKFNNALRDHMVGWLKDRGVLAVAPLREKYFRADTHATGDYSNWSERYVAYAAGLGSFGLSGSFITERGIAARTGSIITDLSLPPSPRAEDVHAGCLYYVNGSCKVCIDRCPAGAITEDGRRKAVCRAYNLRHHHRLQETYGVKTPGCNLCQVKVPCESRDPVVAKGIVRPSEKG